MKPISLIFLVALAVGLAAAAPVEPRNDRLSGPEAADTKTLKHLKIQGSLDLDNGVPIRWKKPDGSGYINIFMLDTNGALQLCRDEYFWNATNSDHEHRSVRVIEVRNPNTKFPDFQLPITRNRKEPRPGMEIVDADSKLQLRSLNLLESNDPAEINLMRTGTDDPNNPDPNGIPANGAVSGLIRWLGKSPKSGFTTSAEIIARSYNTPDHKHYGALVFEMGDERYAQPKEGVLLVMKRGVRIGDIRGMGAGVTGAMLEVNSLDDRPVILRRPEAGANQPVMLALATGVEGTAAGADNTLGLIKATILPAREDTPLSSRLEIQTNKGKRLATDWVLPVPAVEVSFTTDQRIPSDELIALTFDKEGYDSDNIHQAAKDGTRLTCRTAGLYAVSARLEFAANGRGSRQVIVRRNGNEHVAAMRVAALEGETTQITFTSPAIELNPGDYVELMVRQTSGQTLQLPAKGDLTPAFSMRRAG